MGLNVISKIAGTLNTAAPVALSDPAQGLPGEFAALLSGQTLAALLSPEAISAPGKSLDAPGGAQDGEKSADKAMLDQVPANSTTLLDPSALIALMGNPQTQQHDAPLASLPIDRENKEETLPSAVALSPDILPRRETDLPKMEVQPKLTAQAISNASTAAPETRALHADTANIAGPIELPGNSPTFSASLAAAAPPREQIPSHQATVSTPVNNAAWPQQFGEKVVWMAKNDQQTAQININPPQLGPVQITLNLNGDQATAVFASPHAEVRQAIENSMPQLREMLASAGISLGDTNVGANLAQHNQNNAFQTPNRAQSSLENAILPANDNAPVAGVTTPLHQGRGLVDLFA